MLIIDADIDKYKSYIEFTTSKLQHCPCWEEAKYQAHRQAYQDVVDALVKLRETILPQER